MNEWDVYSNLCVSDDILKYYYFTGTFTFIVDNSKEMWAGRHSVLRISFLRNLSKIFAFVKRNSCSNYIYIFSYYSQGDTACFLYVSNSCFEAVGATVCDKPFKAFNLTISKLQIAVTDSDWTSNSRFLQITLQTIIIY